MPRWLTVTLRCWIAFIAFTYIGAAFRCFTDYNFVHSKFFSVEDYQSIPYAIKGKFSFAKDCTSKFPVAYISVIKNGNDCSYWFTN